MQGRVEVEEILEQKLWADRNGLDVEFDADMRGMLDGERGPYLPPAQMLRDHELRTYRDCPMEYEATEDVFSVLGGGVIVLALIAAIGAMGYLACIGGGWVWNNTWGHMVH